MISRDKLLDLLRERLRAHMADDQIDRLAGEILALEGDWEEMNISHQDMGYSHSDLCSTICWLADQTDQGSVIKFLRRKKQ